MALNEVQEQEKEVQNKMVKFQEESSALKETIEYIEIVDDATFKMAEDIRVDIDNYLTGVDGFFDDLIRAAHQTHKLALFRKASVYNPAKALKDILVTKIDSWINKKKQEEEAVNKTALEAVNEATRLADESGNVMTAQDFTAKVQEAFALQPADTDPGFHPKKTEIVKDVQVEIVKPLAFMRYLVSDDAADIDGATLIEWKMGALEKLILADPGREWPSGPEGCLKITRLYKSRLGKGLKDKRCP